MRDAAPALLLALCLALLSGCVGDGAATAGGSDERAETLLTLTPEGAGGLTDATPFDAEAIAGALPEGFVLEPGQIEIDSASTLPVLYAFYDGQIVLEVYPDAAGRVGRIDAASATVASPRGVRPGAGFEDARGGDMACEPGRDELSGRAVCRPASGGPIRYVFAHGVATAPDQLPDREALRQSILERLVWTAP